MDMCKGYAYSKFIWSQFVPTSNKKHIPKSVVTWRELNPISWKCIPKLLAPPTPQTWPQLPPTKTQ